MKRPDDAARRKALADAAAGVVGSLAAVLAFYPVDVWKTSLQAGGGADDAAAAAIDANDGQREVGRRERPSEERSMSRLSLLSSRLPPLSELFRGLPHKLVHTTVSSFAYFFVYSLVQTKYATYRRTLLSSRRNASSGGNDGTSTATKLLLTAFSAVINTCITLPLDTISSRKQAGTSDDAAVAKSRAADDVGGGVMKISNGRANVVVMPSYEALDNSPADEDSSTDEGGFRSARGSFSEEYQSAHSEGDDEREVFVQQSRTDSESPAMQRNMATLAAAPPGQRRQLYIKSPEKYKFSFSTNLAEEAFATSTTATASETNGTASTTPSDEDDASSLGERRRRLRSVLSLWNGLFPAVLLCTNPAIQYTMFDVLKGTLLRRQRLGTKGAMKSGDATERSRPGKLSMWEAFVFGLVSKFFATIVTYPLIRCKVLLMVSRPGTFDDDSGGSVAKLEDASKLANGRNGTANRTAGRQRTQQHTQSAPPSSQSTDKRRPRSLLLLLLHILRNDGVRGMYKGCSLQLLHTVLKSALLMMVRERITLGSRRFFRVEDDAP